MSKVYADVVEIPEGITTLLGDGAALNSFRLRDYDAIGKLIIPSTLQLETVPQQEYYELLDMWFDTSHTVQKYLFLGMANKYIITDRAEIEKHVHTEVWNETVSKYQELRSVLIEIPTAELESWLDYYSEGIALICKYTLTPFQERADEISYIYIEYGGEPKWLRRFAEDEGSWYEMLCDEVLPSWMCRETKWDFYPSIEDALDSESTKQGLHIYVTLCFDNK